MVSNGYHGNVIWSLTLALVWVDNAPSWALWTRNRSRDVMTTYSITENDMPGRNIMMTYNTTCKSRGVHYDGLPCSIITLFQLALIWSVLLTSIFCVGYLWTCQAPAHRGWVCAASPERLPVGVWRGVDAHAQPMEICVWRPSVRCVTSV